MYLPKYQGGNSITNLEALSSLNAIHIEKLYLRKNYLTSLRPLKRCYFPELVHLSLARNIWIYPRID